MEGNVEAHYEALRNAYDERVKSLSKKLRGQGGSYAESPVTVAESADLLGSTTVSVHPRNDLSGSTRSTSAREASTREVNFADEPSRKMRQLQVATTVAGRRLSGPAAPPDEEIAQMREEHIDTLMEKMAHLSTKERDTTARNSDLKIQLEKMQSMYDETKREQSRLSLQVVEMDKFAREEKEWYERNKAESTKRMQDEINRLMNKNHILEVENKKLKDENRDFERRLESLYEERQHIQNEVVAFSKQQTDIHVQLKESQDLLKQSEIERAELRNQYIHVGDKFERLMSMEEKENGETLKQLNHRFKLLKEQKDRQKRRTDKIISDLEQQVKTKDVENERFQLLLDEERNKHQRTEQNMLEVQRKTLHEHNLGLAKLSEMMPINSHQQILEETRRQHHSSIMELEANLRSQYQKQMEEHVNIDEKKQKEFQDTLVHVRSGLKKLEAQRDEAVKKSKASEEELYSLKQALRKLSCESKELEEAKRMFATNLEEANANLGRLRAILEDEKQAHLTTQHDNQELKRKIAIKEEFLAKERGVLMEDIERTIGTKLRWAEDETERLLETCTDQREQVERLKTMVSQKDAKIFKLLEKEAETEKKAAKDQAVGRRAVDMLLQVKTQSGMFIHGIRRELAELKSQINEEMKTIFEDVLINRCESLSNAMQDRQKYMELKSAALVRQIDEESTKVDDQKKQYAEILAQQKTVNKQFEYVVQERDALQVEVEKLKDLLDQTKLNHERILGVIMTAVPGLETHKERLMMAMDGSMSAELGAFRSQFTDVMDTEKDRARQEESKHWTFKLRSVEEAFQRDLLQSKEERNRALTEKDRQATEHQLIEQDLRSQKMSVEEKNRHLTGKVNTMMMEMEEKNQQLQAQVVKIEALDEEVGQLQRALEGNKRENEVLLELARNDAVKPVKAQLREVFTEAEALQKRFAKDLHQRDSQWEQMFEQMRQDSTALQLQREKEYKAGISKLERELDTAKEREQELVSEVARAKHEVTLRANSLLAELDQNVAENKRKDAEVENLKRDVRNKAEQQVRQSKQMQEALDLKTRLAEELQRENRRLIEEREYEIQRVMELKENELEKLQTAIKNQYAHVATVAETISTSERLERKAEKLRAKLNEINE